MNNNDRPLVPIWPDAGDYLGGIKRTTVYDLVDSGEIVRVKVGRRSMITRASLDAYVARITAAATA